MYMKKEFLTGQLISWSGLPSRGVVFFYRLLSAEYPRWAFHWVSYVIQDESGPTQCSQTEFLKLVRCNA